MALAQLEAGKADANARACWNDRSGELTCFNNSLDGLLTSGGARRRAAWWAYKSYADGMDARVASTSTDPRVAVLASARTTRSAPVQVLVGAWSHDGAPATSALSVRLTRLSSVPALAGRSQVRVRTWRIPNSGETSVDRFTATSDRLVSVSGDAIAVSVSLAMYEGALLTVE
jgi:hypothetical protein